MIYGSGGAIEHILLDFIDLLYPQLGNNINIIFYRNNNRTIGNILKHKEDIYIAIGIGSNYKEFAIGCLIHEIEELLGKTHEEAIINTYDILSKYLNSTKNLDLSFLNKKAYSKWIRENSYEFNLRFKIPTAYIEHNDKIILTGEYGLLLPYLDLNPKSKIFLPNGGNIKYNHLLYTKGKLNAKIIF